MSIAMTDFEYNCAFCGKACKTLVSTDKYDQIIHRTARIQDILRPDIFPASYREIFITKLCSKCMADMFGEDQQTFDIGAEENSDELERKITELYEADMRG